MLSPTVVTDCATVPSPAPSDPIYLLVYVESGDDGGGFGETAISKEEYDLVVVTR